MTEEPTKEQIEKKIQSTINECKADEQLIVNLREQRAKLFVKNPNDSKITSLDGKIAGLVNRVANTPSVIKELEKQLATENQRLAQTERDNLLEQQEEVANEVQVLSRSFIATLEKANDINELLIAAQTAEAGLAQKTGKQILENYCHGSMQSLSMLLETMQAQLAGQHTQVVGAGVVPSAVPIRL